VIGAGPSGLACALRLAFSNYDVTVYEKTDRIGGHLWDIMEPAIFLAEFEREFENVAYTLKLHTEITCLDDLPADAVYIATGKNGADFGLVHRQSLTAGSRPGVFLGGSLCSSSTVQAIADGSRAMTLIETYLKTGAMTAPEEKRETRLPLPGMPQYNPMKKPLNGTSFTPEEASEEAAAVSAVPATPAKAAAILWNFSTGSLRGSRKKSTPPFIRPASGAKRPSPNASCPPAISVTPVRRPARNKLTSGN
jgi:hypothetical protein